MKCSVQNCSNDSKRLTKSHGITFHKFPKDSRLRTVWTESLGMINWEPKERSTICSEHFRNENFYETKNGLRRIKGGSIPVATQESAEDLDTAATMRVCRVCLSMNVKMYDLKDFKLDQMLNDITGFTDENEQYLPQKICWECTARLLSVSRFKSMVTRSNNILQQLLLPNKYITIRDIKSVNRTQNGLTSSLIRKIFENGDHDLPITDGTVKEENVTDIDEEEKEGLELDAISLSPLSDVEITNEDSNDEMYFVEIGTSDVDDDEALSKVSADVKPEKICKDKSSKRKANRYKVNESLFTIIPLSRDQQIEEIQMRKESNAYINAPYKCTVCFKGFQSKGPHTAHMVKHSEQNGAYECVICKIRRKSKGLLRKHYLAQHMKQYNCKKCEFVTRHTGVTQAHDKWHSGTKYQCPHCDKIFDKITTYNGHIRIKHVSDFVCELCGYTFVNKKGIHLHKNRRHGTVDKNISLDGPYCDDCKVKFVSQEAYDRHLKVSSKHTSDDDPDRLRNDSQSLITGYTLSRRQRDETVITCEQCGIELRGRRAYGQHFRRVHPDKDRAYNPLPFLTPVVCEQCGKVYKNMNALKDHMWVHTGEKSFKCDLCTKSFTQKPNLVLHMKIHNNTHPSYECPRCGKHFSSLGNMKRHALIHSGLKPYKCKACDKCFTTSHELKSHVDHIHLKKPWPKRIRHRPCRKSEL